MLRKGLDMGPKCLLTTEESGEFFKLLAKDLILQQRVSGVNSKEDVVILGNEYGFILMRKLFNLERKL